MINLRVHSFSSIDLSWILFICFRFEQIDKGMMDELKDVKRALSPTEVLLVVDAMTGQEAAGVCIFRFTC